MKNGQPVLSVIIPVHNRFNLFLKCIKSVISQKYFPLEILVIDDHSTPSLKEYLKIHKPIYLTKIRLTRNKINKGPAESRNIGIKHAKGDYVAFLDSDDIWKEDFSLQMIKKLKPDSNVAAICLMKPIFLNHISFSQKMFYMSLSVSRYICLCLSYFLNDRLLGKSFFYMTRLSGMVFTRKVINEIYFDKRFKAAEDWKFTYELISKNKCKIKIVPKTLVDLTYSSYGETLGRVGYHGYYLQLIDELTLKMKKSLGILLFKIYTNFAIWRINLLKK